MSDYHEMAKELRAKINQNKYYIEKRTGRGDRRKAHFSFVEKERRQDIRRAK